MLYTCPFCNHHKKKLAINVSNGRWHCWVCESGGNSLYSLLKKTNAPKKYFKELSDILGDHVKVEDDTEETVILLPSEYLPLWVPSRDLKYKQAMAYLKRRGITLDDIIKYQLGYCGRGRYAERIIIPSFDINGKLNFFSGRHYYDDSTFPYLNPMGSKNIIGFESLISWKFPIIICEGPMDAIAIRRNAIPLFGKSVPTRLMCEIARNKQSVYLALDKDALSKTFQIATFLVNNDIPVYIVRMEEKDPSQIGFVGMWDLIETTERVTRDDILQSSWALFGD